MPIPCPQVVIIMMSLAKYFPATYRTGCVISCLNSTFLNILMWNRVLKSSTSAVLASMVSFLHSLMWNNFQKQNFWPTWPVFYIFSCESVPKSRTSGPLGQSFTYSHMKRSSQKQNIWPAFYIFSCESEFSKAELPGSLDGQHFTYSHIKQSSQKQNFWPAWSAFYIFSCEKSSPSNQLGLFPREILGGNCIKNTKLLATKGLSHLKLHVLVTSPLPKNGSSNFWRDWFLGFLTSSYMSTQSRY